MKKIYTPAIISFLLFYGGEMFSQNVGINLTGATPNSSAGLDVDFTNKGLLIPRVSLTSTTDVITIPSPATSLLVYNTNAAMTGGGVGYWYWDGTKWVQAIGPTGPTGANGTNGATGPTGTAGTNGTNGVTGPTGTAGTNGTNGVTGPTGVSFPIVRTVQNCVLGLVDFDFCC